MKFVVVFSVFFSISAACTTIKNAEGFNKASTIEHETQAGQSLFAYEVLILAHGDDDIFRCGGAIISTRWVLTAAHCVDMAWAAKVLLGIWRRGFPDEPIADSFLAFENYIMVHEEWDRYNKLNDIALIKSPYEIMFNDFIQPANLPTSSNNYSTYECEIAIASGWIDIGGSKCENDTSHKYILRWTNVLTLKDCFSFTNDILLTKKRHLCVDAWENSEPICKGYLGGPLVRAVDSRTLLGIASFLESTDCEFYTTVVYTRITSYLDWIAKKSGMAKNITAEFL